MSNLHNLRRVNDIISLWKLIVSDVICVELMILLAYESLLLVMWISKNELS